MTLTLARGRLNRIRSTLARIIRKKWWGLVYRLSSPFVAIAFGYLLAGQSLPFQNQTPHIELGRPTPDEKVVVTLRDGSNPNQSIALAAIADDSDGSIEDAFWEFIALDSIRSESRNQWQAVAIGDPSLRREFYGKKSVAVRETWIPPKDGPFSLRVTVKDDDGATESTTFRVEIVFEIVPGEAPPISAVDRLCARPGSPQMRISTIAMPSHELSPGSRLKVSVSVLDCITGDLADPNVVLHVRGVFLGAVEQTIGSGEIRNGLPFIYRAPLMSAVERVQFVVGNGSDGRDRCSVSFVTKGRAELTEPVDVVTDDEDCNRRWLSDE